MLIKSHRLCSIAIVEAGLIVTNVYLKSPVSDVLLLLATGVGAGLPDIDHYNSTVSRKSPINFSLFLRHRGITHTLLGWLIFTGVLYFLMNLVLPIQLRPFKFDPWNSVWLGLIMGYFLHLLEDSFSTQGVNWLMPFHKANTRGRFFRYKVGGSFEKMLAFIAFVLILAMTAYALGNILVLNI
ncbi:metal-dependent hydrolase [Lactobacillus sp. LL6]|uniref:metal-dependent hydrolase n=1 Tax=Lactobacillus sp. LL6 TaxID=2596827 RepID=UPI001184C09B|nr:metal-dependent hydrolase [Lactobacillus sp. LL6]TSO26381.1 metal-dependent hydrolase [Lactobacillus sp. LL6]